MFPTTIAGSLPKPPWLAEPGKLWAPWRPAGAELEAAKLDATLVAIKLQEDAGIDIVTDGEQSRQHFVHGFLEAVNGIDFTKRVEMGIRNDRYKAMVPTVTGPLSLRGRVHAAEARFARAHTGKKLKFTLPGPMTIVDTIADGFYGTCIGVNNYTFRSFELLASVMVGVVPIGAKIRVCAGLLPLRSTEAWTGLVAM